MKRDSYIRANGGIDLAETHLTAVLLNSFEFPALLMFMWKNTLLCCSVELVWPDLCVLVLQYLCIQGYLLQCKLVKISSGQLLVQRSASMYYLYETHVTKKVGTTFGIRSFLFREKCKSRTIWSSSKCAVVG